MSHLVAGYPTTDLALTAARSLVKGGADILEIQLPFSDPSADGPAIQTACTKVLERGYKTADGLDFIASIHKEFPDLTIYLMSYGSLIYTPGVEAFCKRAAAAGDRLRCGRCDWAGGRAGRSRARRGGCSSGS